MRGGRCTPRRRSREAPHATLAHRSRKPRSPFSRPSGWTDSMVSEPRIRRSAETVAATRRSRREGSVPLLHVCVGSSRVREDFPHSGPRRRLARPEHSRRARTRSPLSVPDAASRKRDAFFDRRSEASNLLAPHVGIPLQATLDSLPSQSVSRGRAPFSLTERCLPLAGTSRGSISGAHAPARTPGREGRRDRPA